MALNFHISGKCNVDCSILGYVAVWVIPVIKRVKAKVVPLHATKALGRGGGGGIAPTHSRPRH
jgi:hypothetical protein